MGEDQLPEFLASDGARLFYREAGQGQPLVLLHGLMAHGEFFREQAQLSDRFRLIIPDLRGHGRSSPAAKPGTIGRMAADVEELVRLLALEQAIGIGWSLGATLLWQVLAGAEANRFCGAVVIDMTARVRNGHGWDLGLTAEACDARTAAIRSDFSSFAATAGQNIFAQPIAGERQPVADWASAEFSRNHADSIEAVWAALVEQDSRGLLATIRQPTLVIHGARSRLYDDATADHLVAALPDARAVRFRDSGHAPHLEQPDRFNQVLRDFADRLTCDPLLPATQVQGDSI